MDAEDVCALCGQGVRKVITEGGRIRELEVAPHAEGNHVMRTNARGEIRAHVIGYTELPAPTGHGHRMHHCPKPAPTGPRCSICRDRMNRDVALAEDWDWHPACDPGYQRELGRQLAAIKAGRSRVIYRENTEGSVAA